MEITGFNHSTKLIKSTRQVSTPIGSPRDIAFGNADKFAKQIAKETIQVKHQK